MSPRPDWQLRPHGTAAAARRHYRRGTPLCDSCRQGRRRRSADFYARNVESGVITRAVHADRGDGRPRCGVWNIGAPLIAAPGDAVTCQRCNTARGTS